MPLSSTSRGSWCMTRHRDYLITTVLSVPSRVSDHQRPALDSHRYVTANRRYRAVSGCRRQTDNLPPSLLPLPLLQVSAFRATSRFISRDHRRRPEADTDGCKAGLDWLMDANPLLLSRSLIGCLALILTLRLLLTDEKMSSL